METRELSSNSDTTLETLDGLKIYRFLLVLVFFFTMKQVGLNIR